MGKKSYNGFVLIAFMAICIPMMWGFLKKDNKPNLTGIVINDVNPDSLLKKDKNMWFSGEYQSLKDDYNNDHWAFKESFVRLNNQFYYKAFNQIRVNQFVAGKDNYIFAEVAVNSYYGNDFIGLDKTNEFLRKCKVIQDTLSKKGISFVLVYAPGKGIGAPNFIDDKYKKTIKETNIHTFSKQSKSWGINHIDLVDYFHKIKDTCKYPLYARFAHHWTYYFDCLASKKIISELEKLRNTDLPDVSWSKIDISDTARSRDNDVLKSMNLFSNPPQNQPLAYPQLEIEQDSLKNKTKVLTIGDSYWYGIVYMQIPHQCFAGGQFWYYNKRVVPNPNPAEKTEAWQLDLKQSIESNQVVMIMGSDPALPSFGWGFVDDAYELYTNPNAYYTRIQKSKTIKQYEKQIREKPVLLKKSTKRSQDFQIPLDSAIKLDAMKLAGLN
jgi:hypothetical protein